MTRNSISILMGSLLLASMAFGAPDSPAPMPLQTPVYPDHRLARPLTVAPKASDSDVADAARNYLLALQNYDRIVQTYGPYSRQSEVAVSDLEAAFAIYNRAVERATVY